MKKQTAVEWLEQEIKKLPFVNVLEVFAQAKAMEMEQIEDAFQDGKWDWADHITEGKPSKDPVQYYKEIHKGDNK
jgi:hypothetical protein